MPQTIKLTLRKSQIIETVKNETFLSGQFEKAANSDAITAAYHEQAGDEAYQERMMNRNLQTNLGELKTFLSDYLTSIGNTTADNIYSSEEGDSIILSLVVSDRFNKGFADPLAKLCSKYIEEAMLVDWWKPINDKRAGIYSSFLEKDLVAIRRCFNKTAPKAPEIPYTSTLEVSGSGVDIGIGEECLITYTLSENATDDIEAIPINPFICRVYRSDEGFFIVGRQPGIGRVKVYSRHNDSLVRFINVHVGNQD
jgi:hypothetical protein